MERFKEGWIKLTRPFKFHGLRYPLQKLSILYCYHYEFTYKEELTEEGEDLLKKFQRERRYRTGVGTPEETLDEEEDRIKAFNSKKVITGQIVYTYIEGQECRFYPEEFSILSDKKVNDIMSDEGFHTLPTSHPDSMSIFEDTTVRERVFFLKSRGINETSARRMVAPSLKDKVYFKPYFALLEMFARRNEIFPDDFYEKVEGIKITRKKDEVYIEAA